MISEVPIHGWWVPLHQACDNKENHGERRRYGLNYNKEARGESAQGHGAAEDWHGF